jgi:hypothetical protein
MSALKPCPKCGNPDELVLDSSRHAGASWIKCGWCDHRMQADCCEEALEKRWNKLDRASMPAFDLETELAHLDAEDRASRTPEQPQ